MAKKYFNYSFQIKRTKVGAIILVIFVAIAISIFITWYKNRTVNTKVDSLSYDVVLGMNEFKDNNCLKAYRINYKKNTCGTICINKFTKNSNYLTELQESMKEDGFEFSKESEIKLGNKKWKYIHTINNEFVINNFAIDNNKDTYTIEYIDQTTLATKKNKTKCDSIYNQLTDSIKLND